MFALLRASEFPISLQRNKSLILADENFTLEHSGNYSQNSNLCFWMFKRVIRRTMKFWLPPNITINLEKYLKHSSFFFLWIKIQCQI